MIFEYQIENIGYTRDEALASATVNAADLAAFNDEAAREGRFPAGVTRVSNAYFTPDSKDGGECKYFACVVLEVEADTKADAEALAIPAPLLDEIVQLVAPCTLDEGWELLEVEPVTFEYLLGNSGTTRNPGVAVAALCDESLASLHGTACDRLPNGITQIAAAHFSPHSLVNGEVIHLASIFLKGHHRPTAMPLQELVPLLDEIAQLIAPCQLAEEWQLLAAGRAL